MPLKPTRGQTSNWAGRDAVVKASVKRYRKDWEPVLQGFPRIRFTNGDFATEAHIRREAQTWFLAALVWIPSAPVKRLGDDVWPDYLAALGPLTDSYEPRFQSERRTLFREALRRADLSASTGSDLQIEASNMSREIWQAAVGLVEWSHRFRLRGVPCDMAVEPEKSWELSAWPMLAAEETLWFWYTSPDREKVLGQEPLRLRRCAAQQAGGMRGVEFLKIIDLPNWNSNDSKCARQSGISDVVGWYVAREPEEMFRERMKAQFEAWLDKYTKARRERAKAAGLIRAPQKRDPDHFMWLALYQVEQISASAIASACYVSIDTVKDAIERTASLIGLELRAGKRGRQRRKLGY